MSKRHGLEIISGVILFVALTGFSCARQPMSIPDQPPDYYVMGNKSLVLSAREIEEFQREALRGCPKAALRLYAFYESVRMDYAESLYWLRIAAENDSSVGQYNLGLALRDDADSRNRQRARFWLERSAANGDSLAQELLKEFRE